MNRRSKARVKLILNAPDKVSAHTKLGSNVITIVCWVLYIYLWIPLITLIAWALGATHAYDEMSFARQIVDIKELLINYGLIVALLGGSLLLWALNEYLRFRNCNRRRHPAPASHAELAAHATSTQSDIAQWQLLRSMVALHDEKGQVVGMQEKVANSTYLKRRA